MVMDAEVVAAYKALVASLDPTEQIPFVESGVRDALEAAERVRLAATAGTVGLSIERREMASMLGLHPDMDETWPMDLIDRLVWVKANRPRIDFELEFRAATKR